jgi:hypothetical protein
MTRIQFQYCYRILRSFSHSLPEYIKNNLITPRLLHSFMTRIQFQYCYRILRSFNLGRLYIYLMHLSSLFLYISESPRLPMYLYYNQPLCIWGCMQGRGTQIHVFTHSTLNYYYINNTISIRTFVLLQAQKKKKPLKKKKTLLTTTYCREVGYF